MSRRIAYMTGEYPRATDTFIQREIAAHREAGWKVDTIAVRRPSGKERAGDDLQAERDSTTYVLETSKLKALAGHIKLAISRPARYLSALGLAWRTSAPGIKAHIYQLIYFLEAGVVADRLQAQKIDHLHNHFANSSCSVAMLASALSGVPYSFTLHGPAIFFEPMRWRLDEKIRRASFVSCISHYCRSQAMIHASVEKWSSLHIVHCGVLPEMYSQRRHEGAGRKLLFVGRLAAVKGVPVLLEAMSHLAGEGRDIELTLIGDGPERAELERLADELGVARQVKFAGYRSADEVAAALAETDMFVMASFAEGVPVVLMEALAAGVPVVATRIAGVGELVEDGECGWTVPPGDVDALVDRLRDLLDEPERRSAFGAAGQAMVKAEFDVRKEAEWLREIMDQSLSGQSAPIRRSCEDVGTNEQPANAPSLTENAA